MSLTAKEVSSMGVALHDLHSNASIYLKIIDEGILSHIHTLGKNFYKYVLPVNFQLGIAISDVQSNHIKRFIYGIIVESLVNRGFTVKIYTGKKENTLYVSWESVFKQDDINKYSELLKTVIITTDEELEAFRQ